jgi:GntR family transcriptional regulator, transcriptional repressor for pyruvate dehydrogenase complex
VQPSRTGEAEPSPATATRAPSALELAALESRSKAERVADALEDMIRGRELAPGAFLGTKATLRTQLKVSPATLDTALGVLTDRGLIEMRPGAKGGVRVASTTPSLFMGRSRWPVQGTVADAIRAGEAMALYLALQPHIVARCVPNATASDRRTLRSVRSRLRRSIGDPEAYYEAHHAAHHALLDATHDDVLTMVVRQLMSVLDATTGPAQPPAAEDAATYVAERVAVHIAVIDAVLAKDLDGAWEALLQHGLTPSDVAPDDPVLPPGALEHQARWTLGLRATPRTALSD